MTKCLSYESFFSFFDKQYISDTMTLSFSTVSIGLVLLRIAHNGSYLAYMASLFFSDSLCIFSLKIDFRAMHICTLLLPFLGFRLYYFIHFASKMILIFN